MFELSENGGLEIDLFDIEMVESIEEHKEYQINSGEFGQVAKEEVIQYGIELW
jgi:hypothetical protein